MDLDIRLRKLYHEVDFLLNNAPAEEDCTDDENDMYSEMANLKIAMENLNLDMPPVYEYICIYYDTNSHEYLASSIYAYDDADANKKLHALHYDDKSLRMVGYSKSDSEESKKER